MPTSAVTRPVVVFEVSPAGSLASVLTAAVSSGAPAADEGVWLQVVSAVLQTVSFPTELVESTWQTEREREEVVNLTPWNVL